MSDKRIDEATVKLNEAEKRYLNDNKNLDDLRKIWGTNSELFQSYYDDFMRKPSGTIFTFIITSAGYVLIDSTKQEDGFKQLQGLVADGVMTAISFVLKNTPAGRAVEVVNWAMSLADADVSSLAKKYYDKVLGFDFDKISVTSDGFLKVVMDDGTVYSRPFLPNAHGNLFGGNKDDVLFGGNGKDTLMGLGGNDILIGNGDSDNYVVMNKATIEDTWGNDTYTIMNRARATITDRDGKGTLIVDNEIMRGGTAIEGKKGVYRANGQHFEIYTYDESSKTLTINSGSEFVTIKNFNKNNNDLGITLLDQGEISITISDNEKAEGDNGEQSMNFDIKVNGEIPKGEYAIININGQECLIGNPSTENIKKDNLDISKYKRTLTYTHKWQGNEEKEEDKKFTISGSVVKSSQGLKVKEIISGNGKIIDDDKDDSNDPENESSPIIIDLNKNKITSTKLNNTTYFDHDNNNFKEATSWIDKGDAFLALDKNSNGLIDNGNELFGNHTISNTRFKYTNNKATNGYEALKAYDLNGDNVIDSKDEIYDNTLLWKYDN